MKRSTNGLFFSKLMFYIRTYFFLFGGVCHKIRMIYLLLKMTKIIITNAFVFYQGFVYVIYEIVSCSGMSSSSFGHTIDARPMRKFAPP